MRAVLIVVAHVLSHKSFQVALIEHDQVIEQIRLGCNTGPVAK